ncbi:MAG TPA: hypothetical protein VLR46_06685, partial [Candidatus Dormibacteraeota bacterium]|nr:hypothetical protein [Candidatus Dormibacteraeota bacterium]
MLAHSRAGNYRFLGADGRPFSDGVVADAGFDIARARFEHPVALGQGLEAAVRHVVAGGRQVHAITGIELRIPAPLTQVDFGSFNRDYVFRLRSLGLESDGLMPAARTNVA